jgi:glycosyltransferase involved in cell wall biosynthesis
MKLTIITPTTGRKSLFNAITSINAQNFDTINAQNFDSYEHILLWDDKREDDFIKENNPYSLDYKKDNINRYSIIIPGCSINGDATGSALRSIGLMAAKGEYVTFMDDDIMWENNHISTMIEAIKDKNWAFCKRKIWAKIAKEQYEYLGVDNFESIGEDSKVPYKMVDNSSMIFKRRFGASAAVLYRETKEYNDDRLMYDFLKTYAGEAGKTNLATVNQICPNKLVGFFTQNCTK